MILRWMERRPLGVAGLAVALLTAPPLHAEQKSVDAARVVKAVTGGLRALEKGTLNYAEQRSCFTCHHQTLPLLAQATARKHGFKINEEVFENQTRFTHESFKERHDSLRRGTGIGGKSMTVGFALWALDLAKWKSDETTEAMAAYLLKTQEKDGRFFTNSTRPPLEDSPATSATIAAYFLQRFATDAQKAAAEESVEKARHWLFDYKPDRQEDRNSQLWGMHLLDASDEDIAAARKAVLASQQDDGGWSQLPDMASDSYATGQALWMLQESGLATSDPAYQRGVRLLLDSQQEDGSWLVKTRSKPIQRHFESGFPHGKDQFISICGTSWAVAALAATQPPLREEPP